MTLGFVEKAYIDDIADAIREVSETNEEYYPAEMADAIRRLGENLVEDLEVTENGIYYPSEGMLGFSSVITNFEESEVAEELDLAIVDVSRNGTYSAASEGYDAFSVVNVNVPKKKVSGKKSEDSNEYSVKRDNSGYLVETKIPSYIKVIDPPSKTSYEDNELVKKDGMVVKAYYGDGTEWGTVPLSDITLEPDRASSSSDERLQPGNTLAEVLYYYDEESRWRTHFTQANENTFIYTTPNDSEQNWAYSIYLVSTQSSGTVRDKYRESEEWSTWGSYVLGNKYEKDGKAIWHSRIGGTNSFYQPVSTPLPRAKLTQDEAWNIFYGDSASQRITIKLARPEDDEELTDTFEITVH